MKKTVYILFAGLLALTLSCKKEGIRPKNIPAIDVTTQKLEPAADESGSVRAFVGTEVTAKGFNLDKVGLVKLNDLEAEIVSKDIKTLVFKVPDLGLAQRDDPHQVKLVVYGEDKSSVIFNYNYYVTVPVTDALVSGFEPKTGTVGTQVVISGRNLTQVTAVKVEGVNAELLSAEDAKVTFTLPPVSTDAAQTDLEITAIWSGGEIDVTETEPFVLNVPVFSAYTQGEDAAVLGDEISFTGENVDLASGFSWGDIAFLVVEQNATSVTLKIPTGIEEMTPAVQAKDITATYGTPAQKLTLVKNFKVDTTPIGPAAPVFTSITPVDTNYAQIYLGKEMSVKGENFASVEKFVVDGVEAALVGEPTDVEARFAIPTTITGTAAKAVSLKLVWGGGNELDCGTITVYPFYYTKGLKLRIGSNSKNSYPEANREDSFLLLDEGRIVSVQEWYDTPVDPFAKSGNNTVTSAAGKAAGTDASETNYYSVQPYTFAISNSSNKLSLCNPANTANQLKTHYLDGTTALPTTFGTPIMYFAVVTDETLRAAAAGGTLADIVTGAPKASAGAPACGAAETSSVWVKGSVIAVQYMDYTSAHAGSKPGDAMQGVRKAGYIYISDITCVDANGAAVATREGYIELDLYWSNVLE